MKNLFENWRMFKEDTELLNEVEIGAPPWSILAKEEVLEFLKDIDKGAPFKNLVGRLLTFGGKNFDVEYAVAVIESLVEDGYLIIDKAAGTSYARPRFKGVVSTYRSGRR